jgi:sporulation protein YlmC with PRC-barrel domain
MDLILGKDIIDSKIVHVNNEVEDSTVKNILLNMEARKLCYLTLKLKKPSNEMDERKHKSLLELLNPFSDPDGMEKQLYLIPEEQIEQMMPGNVVMKGKKIEQEREIPRMECTSYSITKEFKVETESGEELGKIKDIVLNREERELVGLQLGEGLWNNETKYMPYDGIVEWGREKLIVSDDITEKMGDEVNQLA